jgi:hypothetical protein
MKKLNYPSKKLLNTAILAMGIHLMDCNSPQMQHHLISVEAPFEMPAIQVPVYPDQDYPKSYAKYVEKESEMPFDQHMLLSCIAPRALMIQGFNEPWFDTEGEFLALKAASPIWEFLGEEGLPQVEWPDTYDLSAVGRKLAYYRRNNLHGIAAFDWVQMIEFAEKLFSSSRNCKEQ